MLKVLVIDRCENCDGEAYLYASEYKDVDVERPVYQACPACKGSGEREKAISLSEFADLLDQAFSKEPDHAELAMARPISAFADSLHVNELPARFQAWNRRLNSLTSRSPPASTRRPTIG